MENEWRMSVGSREMNLSIEHPVVGSRTLSQVADKYPSDDTIGPLTDGYRPMPPNMMIHLEETYAAHQHHRTLLDALMPELTLRLGDDFHDSDEFDTTFDYLRGLNAETTFFLVEAEVLAQTGLCFPWSKGKLTDQGLQTSLLGVHNAGMRAQALHSKAIRVFEKFYGYEPHDGFSAWLEGSYLSELEELHKIWCAAGAVLHYLLVRYDRLLIDASEQCDGPGFWEEFPEHKKKLYVFSLLRMCARPDVQLRKPLSESQKVEIRGYLEIFSRSVNLGWTDTHTR